MTKGLVRKSEYRWEGKHLIFSEEQQTNKNHKTKIWSVWNKYEVLALGSIEWCTKFRKYSFYPLPDRVFEQDCLRDIAQFVEDRTAEHMEAAFERKQNGG